MEVLLNIVTDLMRNDGSVVIVNGVATGDPCADPQDLEKQSLEGRDLHSSREFATLDGDQTVLSVVVSNGESFGQVSANSEPVVKFAKTAASTVGEVANVGSPKKAHLSRNTSSHEQCR